MDLATPGGTKVGWTFLSNHGHVLLAVARDPDVTLRAVAAQVGITERAVQRIVADLEAARYLERVRRGRRNRYEVHPEIPLRHSLTAHRDIGDLIELMVGRRDASASASPLPAVVADTTVRSLDKG